MSDPTPEQRELSLVGKVEMRIALADSDSKLESVLKIYLAPLLLKLASEHSSVRTKVISVCQHINTRVQPQNVQLPVASLVQQFKERKDVIVRHFDMLYILQGVDRLSSADKAELLPIIVKDIAKNGSHGSQIFNMLLKLLPSFTIPPRESREDVELRQKLGVSDEDVRYLAERFGKLILFTPQKKTYVCPGLTLEDFAFLTVQGKTSVWDPAAGGLNLLKTKILVARFLASGLFNDKERFLPALYASADPASSISDIGDDMMKRALPATDLEDEALIHHLFHLYFGSEGTPRVRAPLRLKILGLLNKSMKSTTFSNNITSLVNDGVAPPQQDGEDAVMSGVPQQSTNVGREATKLRAAIFTYINFVARFGSKESLHAIAQLVVNRLRDFIDNQGWPKPGTNEDLTSRGYAYEVIGLLAKAGPRTVLVEEEPASLELVRWLFESLARDSSGNSITVSIEEALSTVLSALSTLKLNGLEQEVLESLLVDEMRLSSEIEEAKRFRSTRYVAVRYANRCLPYSSIKARWVDVLAAGAESDRPEVREEGERGLSPYWYRMLNGSAVVSESIRMAFPDFKDVIEFFFISRTGVTSTDPAVVASRSHDLYKHSFAHMTAFARRMLVQQALTGAQIAANLDNEWERQLDAMVESDLHARDAVETHLMRSTTETSNLLDILLCALFTCTTSEMAFSEDHLHEFLALSPESLISHHVSRAKTLLPTLKSNNHGRRMAAAQAFGILASHQAAQVSTSLGELLTLIDTWSSAVGASLSTVHGATIALGFYYSRWACRRQEAPESTGFQSFLKTLFEMFASSRDSTILEACYIAIGQMCMFGCLTSAVIDQHSTVRKVTDKLYEKAKDGTEAAILCLGQLSMVLPEDDEEMLHVQEQLHKLHEIRQSEVHFTVGEAFTYLATGWKSSALATKMDVNGGHDKLSAQARTTTLQKLVDQTLKDCANTKPALKKAAVMWLLCLVQFCGDQIQDRLSECQAAFRRCLSDRDELVQESASRGLGLVYEKGDRGIKDDLVRELVSSFSSDKQTLAGNVSAETQLFEPGQLPTGEGSVSTYKDIMSLASEVGDSSLVYKFMSMASSNAIWSSRAAFGRFGLSRVLSDSSFDGYLANNPKLYPKLFRYRFDPNDGVQRSMTEIWNALVPDPTATIEKHFDAIMEDLLTSILGKEWRVRQACCAAIADLVQGRPLEKYEGYLERIWGQCFKVLDDIKESVRAAASTLARTLTGVLTRALEADHSSTKNASTMLKHVLPFLLSRQGLESSAKDVQAFSVHTLLEIIKKGNGATIRPFIPQLIEKLIEMLGSLEHEMVNYIHLNADKYNLTQQKIDDMRLAQVKGGPLMEAIERCLDLLDDDTMKASWPRIENAMKSAVGLPSKVGSSRVLVSLSTRRMVLFRPFSDDALRLIEKLAVDRNETVSSSYAVAAGYVARGASDKQIVRLIGFAKRLYFESEGDREGTTPRRSITSGEIVQAFAKYASDKFHAFAAQVLPFVFVAKHDSNDHVKEAFAETWNESVGGGSRAVNLYLGEILELSVAHLDSPQWTLKHTAARCVAGVAMAVANSQAGVDDKTGAVVWNALEKALAGKTWEGKEVVLAAFARFVEVGETWWAGREDVKSAVVKIAVREAKRLNVAYRQHSIKALARVARARTDIDMHAAVVEIVEPLLEPESEDAMDVDKDKDKDKDQARKTEEIKEATCAGAIEALFASINATVSDAVVLSQQMAHAAHVVVAAKPVAATSLRSLYEGIRGTFDRTREQRREELALGDEAMRDLRWLLFGPALGIEAVRLVRADAVVAVAEASRALAALLEAEVRAQMSSEVSPVVRERLAAALRTA